MVEISDTFEGVGLPGDFHEGAREIYHRMAGFKDADPFPDVDDVLAAILQS